MREKTIIKATYNLVRSIESIKGSIMDCKVKTNEETTSVRGLRFNIIDRRLEDRFFNILLGFEWKTHHGSRVITGFTVKNEDINDLVYILNNQLKQVEV